MKAQSKEGWYTDPFGRHEARWMSDGMPTRLVRDGGVEGNDDPPDEPPSREPVRIEDPDASGRSDLRRADEAEAGSTFDDARLIDAASEMITESSPRP